MFNSTVHGAARWVLPRYFDYDIVNGPANTSVEWIRIYVPGQWYLVAANTLGPAPMTPPPIGNGARSTTSKCIGLGKVRAAPPQALFRNRYPMQPSILGITGTGSPGDTNVWVVHAPASRGQFSLRVHRTSCMLD